MPQSGKNRVNLEEGKKSSRGFLAAVRVICDTQLLTSLPDREMRSGMGELAKYHFGRRAARCASA